MCFRPVRPGQRICSRVSDNLQKVKGRLAEAGEEASCLCQVPKLPKVTFLTTKKSILTISVTRDTNTSLPGGGWVSDAHLYLLILTISQLFLAYIQRSTILKGFSVR